MNRLSVASVMLCLLQACSQEAADTDSYFPLHTESSWTYRVTTSIAGTRNETRFEVYNAVPEAVDGVLHAVRVTDQGTRYYIRDTDAGVFRAAKRTVVEQYPRPDNPPRWILKRPFQPGNTWSNETHPYVLRRVQPYEEGLATGMRFKMAYQIGSLQERVEVPAGRFENCLRIDGDAKLTVYADGRSGYQDIEINTTEWYAPGVGLVKLVRDEPLNSDVIVGGRIVFELERFVR